MFCFTLIGKSKTENFFNIDLDVEEKNYFLEKEKPPAWMEYLARLLSPLVFEAEVLRDGRRKSIFTWREREST